MDGTLLLTLLFSASLHLTAPATVSDSRKSNDKHGPSVIRDAELIPNLFRPHSNIDVSHLLADSRSPAGVKRLPLDVVFVTQRLYEPPTAVNFAVVTPYDPDNREAGVELRCNSQAVASTTWTLHDKSNTLREFHWKLTDESCLYELVAVLTKTRDYLYLYQMVPSRAWLAYTMPSRQFGRGSRY